MVDTHVRVDLDGPKLGMPSPCLEAEVDGAVTKVDEAGKGRARYLSPMPKITFDLTGEYVELNQLLKLVGLCNSGGEGKMLVAQGEVTVDGAQELRKTAKVRAGQVVRLHDMTVTVRAGDTP